MNLQIIKEDNKYLWLKCPKHDYLEKPPLCINKAEINGKPKGFGYCFCCGYRIDIPPEEIDNMSKKKTICRKTAAPDWIELDNKYRMNTFIKGKYHELEREWNVKSLLKYGIGWNGKAHTFPMRNELGEIIGLHKRFPNGNKRCVEGSLLGLFMPNIPIVQPVVVVEGLSDAAMITELGFWGLGLPSASFGHFLVKKFLVNQNYSGKVLIVADADEVGKKSAKKMRNVLTNKFKCGIIEPEVGKDLRDFVGIKGRQYAKSWIKENL